MTFDEQLQVIVQAFEALGVGILLIGCLFAFITFALDLGRGERATAFSRLRGNVGRTILLGLEILIVADIVLTVAIDQTFESALTLGLIVLVRTFLSFSLEVELDGVVPWRRRAVEAGADARPPESRPSD